MAEVISTVKPVEYREWHDNWLTFEADVIQAWEPDNTCIYTGNDLNEACKALNNSTFGDLD